MRLYDLKGNTMFKNLNEIKDYLNYYAKIGRPFNHVWFVLSKDFNPEVITEHKDNIEKAYTLLCSMKEIKSVRYGRV